MLPAVSLSLLFICVALSVLAAFLASLFSLVQSACLSRPCAEFISFVKSRVACLIQGLLGFHLGGIGISCAAFCIPKVVDCDHSSTVLPCGCALWSSSQCHPTVLLYSSAVPRDGFLSVPLLCPHFCSAPLLILDMVSTIL